MANTDAFAHNHSAAYAFANVRADKHAFAYARGAADALAGTIPGTFINPDTVGDATRSDEPTADDGADTRTYDTTDLANAIIYAHAYAAWLPHQTSPDRHANAAELAQCAVNDFRGI